MSEEKVEKLQQEEALEAQEGAEGAAAPDAELTDEQAQDAAGGWFFPRTKYKNIGSPDWMT